jgi:hypothetical protein
MRCIDSARVGAARWHVPGDRRGFNSQEQTASPFAVPPDRPVHSSNRAVGVHRARATVGRVLGASVWPARVRHGANRASSLACAVAERIQMCHRQILRPSIALECTARRACCWSASGRKTRRARYIARGGAKSRKLGEGEVQIRIE